MVDNITFVYLVLYVKITVYHYRDKILHVYEENVDFPIFVHLFKPMQFYFYPSPEILFKASI